MTSKQVIDSANKAYDHFKTMPSNLNEHFETIRKYASRCKHITEFGTSELVSCWALAKGLADNGANVCSLTCVDIKPVPASFANATALLKRAGIRAKYVQGDSLKIRIQPSDLLLIDTFHCFPQLKRELERCQGNITKYIIVPNTELDGQSSEVVRLFYEYNIDEECKKFNGCSHEDICTGLMPAIQEFVAKNSNTWRIAECHKNNNGLVVLERF